MPILPMAASNLDGSPRNQAAIPAFQSETHADIGRVETLSASKAPSRKNERSTSGFQTGKIYRSDSKMTTAGMTVVEDDGRA